MVGIRIVRTALGAEVGIKLVSIEHVGRTRVEGIIEHASRSDRLSMRKLSLNRRLREARKACGLSGCKIGRRGSRGENTRRRTTAFRARAVMGREPGAAPVAEHEPRPGSVGSHLSMAMGANGRAVVNRLEAVRANHREFVLLVGSALQGAI